MIYRRALWVQNSSHLTAWACLSLRLLLESQLYMYKFEYSALQCLCRSNASQTYLWFLVEKLNEKQGDRIRFFLSKADTAGQESDRQVFTNTVTTATQSILSSTSCIYSYLGSLTAGNKERL